MDLRKILTGSPKANKITQVVDYVISNTSLFKQLISIYLSGPYRVTQFTTHAIEGCLASYPYLINPYLGVLLKSIQKPETHNAEKRNTLKLLQLIDVPKGQRAKLIDICFKFLHDKKEANAVRVFSMSVIYKNAKEYPEIQNELRVMIEDELPYGTPAFRSRARKVLSDMEKRQI